jgi:X-Pro dipeptidyl-peptidase
VVGAAGEVPRPAQALAAPGRPRRSGNSATYALPDGTSWTYKQTENRWFDHWLWGVPNGIMDEPRAIVQREDGRYTTYADWPEPAARPVPLRLAADDATAPGTLSTRPHGHSPLQRFVDEGRTIPPADLVDYGPPGATAAPFVVSRGWTDPQNRLGPDRSRPIRQGRLATHRWVLQPKDYVFPAGHRVGLVVFSSDQEYTLLPLGGTRLTVDPGSSRLTLPVVGGRAAAVG